MVVGKTTLLFRWRGWVIAALVGIAFPSAAQAQLPEVSLVLTPSEILRPGALVPEISENGTLTVTATMDKAASATVTVTISVAPANYNAPGEFATEDDYVVSDNKVLTFAPGSLASTGVVTITGVDDGGVARTLRRIRISATASSNARMEFAFVEFFIEDDDPHPTKTAVLTPAVISEKGGVATVTAELSHPTLIGDVLFDVQTGLFPEGTPRRADRSDFVVSDNVRLVVAKGETLSTGRVTITAVDNDVVGPAQKRLGARLHNVDRQNGPTEPGRFSPWSILTIEEDDKPDKPTVSLSAAPNPHVPEGDPVLVTATLSSVMSSAVTVPLTMTAMTAEPDDYGLLESITIGGGQLSGSGTVTTADDADEDDETFMVALGTLPPEVTAGSPSSVRVTIRDDDRTPPPPDEDEDGFEDRIESEAPNNGDGNCDGVPDAEQSHVVSFPNARDGRYVTLAVPGPIRLSGIRTLSRLPRGYPPLPPDVTAPIRFLGFYLGRVGRGGEVTVSVYLPAGLEVNSYWQYGPAADTGAPQWYPFGYDGETGARFPQDAARQGHCEARRIELHFIDGARGDDDLRRNGVVASFGAPVLAAPALAPVSLGLPGEDPAVGVALHNPTDADNAVALSVVDGGGETHRQVELEPALVGKGQLARMVCELIDCEPESGAAAVVARGRQGHLQGMFMVGDRAGSGRKLDGLSGKFDLARRLFFPIVQSESDRATLLFVFNPSLEETDVTFRRYRGDRSLSGSASRTVAGGGFVMETAAGLFGGADDGEQVHVEARARRSLLGFAFLRDEESFAALAAQPPQDLPDDGSFHAPHFELGAESRTSLYVLSALAGHTTRLRVRAFDNHGHPLGEAERELSRAAGSLLLVSDVGALLQLPPSAQQEGLIEGYLQLDFSVTAGPLHHFAKPRVLGAVEVVRGGNRTVLPLVGPEDRPARSFLQVAHSDRPDSHMFTSLSILNPGPQTAMVTLRVFDPTGRQSAPERILSIAPGSRLSGSLEAEWLLDPQFKQVGGHLQIISDRPVISFALLSGRNGQYLSAITSRPGSP